MEWSRSCTCRQTTAASITANRHSSAATDFRECISPYTPYRRTSSRNGSTGRETPHPPWTGAAMSPCCRRARTFARSPTGPSSRACLRPLSPSRSRRGRGHPVAAAACRSAPQEPNDMLGKLTWNAIPWDQPIPLVAGSAVFSAAIAVVAWVVLKGHMPYLWREWITSVDHKRIGIMYMMLGLVMLVRGFIDAIMMRSQQAFAFHAPGYLPPEHYNQIFAAPLQLGVRDVAFPTLNSTSFWLTATGALFVNLSLVIGEFARTGWLPYPPLSETTYTPGVGVDYYLWALLISGVGTLMTGINFVTTILKIRAPGMSYLRMTIFCWTALAANLLIVAAFPILTATLGMLALDRYL